MSSELPDLRLKWFLICVAFRLLLVFTTRTYFTPDEIYQSLEPALSYGYRTWEWTSGLRSPLMLPLMSSKICRALLAALADISTVSLAADVLGAEHALPVLWLSLCNPFLAYASTRPLANSLEYAIFCIFLAIVQSHEGFAFVLAALSAWARPTAAILYVPIAIFQRPFKMLLYSQIAVGMACLGVAVDTLYYGKATFTPLEFVKVNFFTDRASFYGVNSGLYYFLIAVPVCTTFMLPFCIAGAVRSKIARLSALRNVAIFALCVFTTQPHKEFRFIMPLTPIFTLLASSAMSRVWAKKLAIFTLVIIGPIMLYLNIFHMSGQIQCITYLKEAFHIKSLGMLMPCHSTPWQFEARRPDLINHWWDIACVPTEVIGPDNSTWHSEEDFFYHDPVNWYTKKDGTNPTHLLLFESLLVNFPEMKDLLDNQGYAMEHSWWNSLIHEDTRRSGRVILMSRLKEPGLK